VLNIQPEEIVLFTRGHTAREKGIDVEKANGHSIHAAGDRKLTFSQKRSA